MSRPTAPNQARPGLHVAHAVPGRIRLHAHQVRGNSQHAEEVARRLGAVPGVELAKVNPATGSITVHYRHSALESAEFFAEVAAALGLIVAGVEAGEVEALFRLLGAAPSELPAAWGAGGWPALSLPIAFFALGVLVGRRFG